MSLARWAVRLTKTDMSKTDIDRVRKDLKVAPLSLVQGFGKPPSFKVYHETAQHLYVPRHYAEKTLGVVVQPQWNPESFLRRDNLRFEGALKEATRQPEAVAACLRAFDEQGGGVLSLPTGYGKTTVGLYVACQKGVKTLVLTHKEFLMDQWIERIKTFVPSARVGKIRQDIVDVTDKDIVVGMMQSICLKNYTASVFEDFGLLIVDEAHHVSAPVFCQCMFKASCPWVLGLSATPERKDGLTKVLEWFLGPIFFKIERQMQRHVSIEVFSYDSPAYALPPPVNRAGTVALAEIINRMCADPARNAFLVQTIRDYLKGGRKIIILSDRREHCAELCRALEPDASLYIGGMKQADLKKAEEARVIVATYGQANEGLDIPALDTLVLATPRSDVVQAVGRILREASQTKTQVPTVADILDCYGVCYAQYNKRKAYYKRAGFTINHARTDDETDDKMNDDTCAFQDD